MLLPPQNAHTYKSCFHCIHFKTEYINKDGRLERDEANCIAFPAPAGIPDEIYDNGHYEPRPDLGQTNDVVFEPNEEFIQSCKWRREQLASEQIQPDFGQSAVGAK